jgi:hypothetical protein
MGARRTPESGSTTGNFVAEWFGHRVWPDVDRSESARANQARRACPFLTIATGEFRECVKWARGWIEPYGVCTISSDSNDVRQDWIACPNRTLDQHFTLLATAVRYSYLVTEDTEVLLLPLTVLHRQEQRSRISRTLNAGGRVFLFSSQKLGGEIDLPETEASPGAAVDISAMEVTGIGPNGKPTEFGKHLLYEIQTSDFHGSPLHAAEHLKTLCPKGNPRTDYHRRLAARVEVCGTGVEGPNKANIFKRTIYQMIFKIELARHPDCAGFAIVLPVPVWDSWLRHLGQPQLPSVDGSHDHHLLLAPNEHPSDSPAGGRATIYVFDIDRESREAPRPLRIVRKISCSSGALVHHAFTVASDQAKERDVVATFRTTFIERVGKGWKGSLRVETNEERQ